MAHGPLPTAKMDGISQLNLSPAVVKGELRDAYFTLSSHGLLHSAKWVAEQAAGIGKGVKAVLPTNSNSNFENDEDDAIVLGKAFFDVREYRYDYSGSLFFLFRFRKVGFSSGSPTFVVHLILCAFTQTCCTCPGGLYFTPSSVHPWIFKGLRYSLHAFGLSFC